MTVSGIYTPADDECQECDGTGMVCLCCKSALDECSCGPDAEPCYCDKCHGSGTKDEDAEAERIDNSQFGVGA